MNKKNIVQPGASTVYVTRIWHWRKKCFLCASDYGLKAFPIKRNQ